jgi:DNA topoisomerase-1
MVGFAESLPRLRQRLTRPLRDGEEPSHERVLALAVRLLDIGTFRVGSEQYADEDSGIGLATIRRERVRIEDDAIAFDYPGKEGTRRRQVIEDPMSIELVRALKRRRGGRPSYLRIGTGVGGATCARMTSTTT